MSVTILKRRSPVVLLTILCTLISLVRYHIDGEVPILSLKFFQGTSPIPSRVLRQSDLQFGVQNCECVCKAKDEPKEDMGSDRKRIPYVAPGPSKVQELIPMDVLKKSISLNEHSGLKHLDHTSLSHYYQCKPSKNSLFPRVRSGQKQCLERKFTSRNGPITALVSFNGSGNTWLRYLIEHVTGIFTGSIYCDPVLKLTFPGESVVSSNVIAVKTHHSDTRDLPKDVQLETGKQRYDKAIVLVRNPFDALVSEANRRWNTNHTVNSHIGLAEETTFVSNSKWDWFVEYKSVAWAFLLHTWLSQTDTPIHVVQYERLVKDLRQELVKILNFLEFDTTDENIDCVVENNGGAFKRKSHLNFDPYSKENKWAVNRCISQAAPLLAKYDITYKQR